VIAGGVGLGGEPSGGTLFPGFAIAQFSACNHFALPTVSFHLFLHKYVEHDSELVFCTYY